MRPIWLVVSELFRSEVRRLEDTVLTTFGFSLHYEQLDTVFWMTCNMGWFFIRCRTRVIDLCESRFGPTSARHLGSSLAHQHTDQHGLSHPDRMSSRLAEAGRNCLTFWRMTKVTRGFKMCKNMEDYTLASNEQNSHNWQHRFQVINMSYLVLIFLLLMFTFM